MFYTYTTYNLNSNMTDFFLLHLAQQTVIKLSLLRKYNKRFTMSCIRLEWSEQHTNLASYKPTQYFQLAML